MCDCERCNAVRKSTVPLSNINISNMFYGKLVREHCHAEGVTEACCSHKEKCQTRI